MMVGDVVYIVWENWTDTDRKMVGGGYLGGNGLRCVGRLSVMVNDVENDVFVAMFTCFATMCL